MKIVVDLAPGSVHVIDGLRQEGLVRFPRR